ncbi:hypothetical protein K435DRAFT_867228 [Dendrothele bispora CBS 962.96]|uniref:DUF6924 domain-containing protein n=1 Tax=Dendrothele bispora (strain CBS 962.96) TaxID=1314807 RepID=A0A4S8LFB3_DENBC|nr:hypothetical protein K435DRAFT_867228 [Dendrothele bispora CBS 962.96]
MRMIPKRIANGVIILIILEQRFSKLFSYNMFRPNRDKSNDWQVSPSTLLPFLTMPERKIALYVSSSAVTPECQAQIHHDFDTAPSVSGGQASPGWIEFVPESKTWSVGLSPEAIHTKHSEQFVPRYPRRPVIILDERTARDGSVLVVSPVVNEQTNQFEYSDLRFVSRRVPDAAMNLVIGNQTLAEYKYHVDEDGVWRWFKNSTVPNPDT